MRLTELMLKKINFISLDSEGERLYICTRDIILKLTLIYENYMKNKLVLSKDVIDNIDEYNQWLQQIKTLYKNSQIKASVKVNRELLEFYWQLGREMYERKIEEVWGSGIVERLSLDLKTAFPLAKGFSTTNLWYIKKWYLFYYQEVKKVHQLGGELLKLLFSVPWKHHCVIIIKSIEYIILCRHVILSHPIKIIYCCRTKECRFQT